MRHYFSKQIVRLWARFSTRLRDVMLCKAVKISECNDYYVGDSISKLQIQVAT
jgi:hypothetical protein